MDNVQFQQIKFDIRNFGLLTKEQISNIHKMDEKQKEEIIIIYNDIIHSLVFCIQDYS